ncbi:hypothetical protein CBF34_02410 [Vagococcus penaei]|uniref:Uncharacterized protein n=1 Tax=Vagococcus penaei TaxID=633807 RepID=A0A1Q2D4F3_9ENTE|nr:GNAT family N-acetyltransferase [Vagococcus penaei]AQP53155.1 hypothetical protein BW732_02180 [Vagococcus penaei]RSU05982.1 hypothetical protein CBF34_02410 [Vagococcus penaei]
MIRQAQPKDVTDVINLVMIILKDMELAVFDKLSDEEVLNLLEEAYTKYPTYRYGYQTMIVKEIDGQVAGIAVGYPDKREKTIDADFITLLNEHGLSDDYRFFTEIEAFPNEWYLDTLVTSPDFRRQGVANSLLDALPEIARQQGCDKIGLNCDQINQQAQQVYLKKGFKKMGETTLSNHRYDHLQWLIN